LTAEVGKYGEKEVDVVMVKRFEFVGDMERND